MARKALPRLITASVLYWPPPWRKRRQLPDIRRVDVDDDLYGGGG